MCVHVCYCSIRVEAWSGHILSGDYNISKFNSDLVLSVQLGYFDCFSASICLIVYWTMKLASLMYGCLGILAKLKSAFLAMTNVTKWSVSL